MAGIEATRYNIEQVQNAGRSNPAAISRGAYSSLASELKQLQDLQAEIADLQAQAAAASGASGGLQTLANPAGGIGTKITAATAGTPGSPATAGPYSVNVDLGGGRSAQIGLSSPLQADKLAALLNQLKADMARAGG